MRVLNDNNYGAILNAARTEFIRTGFKGASMRVIARDAGVGLSNIYNYYRNKDEIFAAVVEPAKRELFKFIADKHNENNLDFDFMSSLAYQEDTVNCYIKLLRNYREELRLLLYGSDGSSQSGFRDSFTEFLTDVSYNHMILVREHYSRVREISSFFVHTLCAFMVSIVGEIITHDLDDEKIREFFREYFKYSIAGWRELTGL